MPCHAMRPMEDGGWTMGEILRQGEIIIIIIIVARIIRLALD